MRTKSLIKQVTPPAKPASVRGTRPPTRPTGVPAKPPFDRPLVFGDGPQRLEVAQMVASGDAEDAALTLSRALAADRNITFGYGGIPDGYLEFQKFLKERDDTQDFVAGVDLPFSYGQEETCFAEVFDLMTGDDIKPVAMTAEETGKVLDLLRQINTTLRDRCGLNE
jgi:hypothetical protein